MAERNMAFRDIKALYPGRSVFDLSHEHVLTCDMGQLIPVMYMDMVPGDKFEVSTDMLIRFQPLLAPIMHPVNAYIHTFFVPYRLLWPKIDETGNNWESFISGGVDGLNAASLPRWNVSSGYHDVGSLWDYFGFPTWSAANNFATAYPDAIQPLNFPLTAYNLIYNEYYRDETLQAVTSLTQESVQYRSWKKDYFTSSLPWQQRGTAPAFPVSGTTSAVFSASHIVSGFNASNKGLMANSVSAGDDKIYADGATPANNARNALNNNTVSLDSAVTFDVADLRYAVQLQRWLERNARAGVRYTEFLHSHFGVSPTDSRLQRPEYVGGLKMPVVVSEVLQTSAVDGQPTPLATMGGHGISVDRQYQGKYFAEEYGVMMSILSVIPEAVYSQGIDRQWLRNSRYDFFFPEFAHLSEQAILNQEVFLHNDGENQQIFGYQGRYDEYRNQRSKIHGLIKSDLKFWTLARLFGSRPHLNSSFITMSSAADDLKRIFAVPSQPGLVVHVGNKIRAVRPMPEIGEPGLMDH